MGSGRHTAGQGADILICLARSCFKASCYGSSACGTCIKTLEPLNLSCLSKGTEFHKATESSLVSVTRVTECSESLKLGNSENHAFSFSGSPGLETETLRVVGFG